jgi:hypothetical protein
VICNGRPFKISVGLENSKAPGEIRVLFRLRDQRGQEVARPAEVTKTASVHELSFATVARTGRFQLSMWIDEFGITVPGSEKAFALVVKDHSVADCTPCLSASLASSNRQSDQVLAGTAPSPRACSRPL